MKNVNLGDLYIGKLDAKHEIRNRTQEARFIESFLLPPRFDLKRFVHEKDLFYVVGNKGSGKTALLRYLSIESEKRGHTTHFVLFKSDLSPHMKKTLQSLHIERTDAQELVSGENGAYSTVADVSTSLDVFNKSVKDYEAVWTWFLVDRLFYIIDTQKLHVVQNTAEAKDIRAVLSSIDHDPKSLKKGRRLPKLTHGNVTLSIGLSELIKADLKGEFAMPNDNNNGIGLGLLSDLLVTLVGRLEPGTDHVNIFVDELEILPDVKKIQERDIFLIRDLVVTIYRLNILFQSLELPIQLVASIRTEVLSHPKMTGKEINKLVKDFGTLLVWHNYEPDDVLDHPLINLLTRRLINLDDISDVDKEVRVATWQNWFPVKLHDKDSARFVLDQTWYRPRDIIRLLKLAAEAYPEEYQFRQNVFDGTRKLYSNESWVEIVEELAAVYSYDDISFIERFLSGIEPVLEFTGFRDRFHTQCEKNRTNLTLPSDVEEFAGLLFRLGIIGNRWMDRGHARYRFVYRGDNQLIVDSGKHEIMIHIALQPRFASSRHYPT